MTPTNTPTLSETRKIFYNLLSVSGVCNNETITLFVSDNVSPGDYFGFTGKCYYALSYTSGQAVGTAQVGETYNTFEECSITNPCSTPTPTPSQTNTPTVSINSTLSPTPTNTPTPTPSPANKNCNYF